MQGTHDEEEEEETMISLLGPTEMAIEGSKIEHLEFCNSSTKPGSVLSIDIIILILWFRVSGKPALYMSPFSLCSSECQ